MGKARTGSHTGNVAWQAPTSRSTAASPRPPHQRPHHRPSLEPEPEPGSAPGSGAGRGSAPGADSDPAPEPPSGARSSRYRDVLGVREFQALWLGHALSMVGGNLLTLAVTVLVYQQTSSALAAGFTVALTFLPQIVGGPLLSGLADLFPRRQIMILCDLARAGLIAAIAIPGLPLPLLWGLLFLAILPLVPFGAARAALLTDVLRGDRYVTGSALINMTSQAGALVGLLLGGAVVTLIGPNTTVLLNGGTFLLSALVIVLGVHARPAPHRSTSHRPGLWAVTKHGARVVRTDPRLRTMALIAWLAGFYTVPLGLANPLAADINGGAATVSVIMAAAPAGALVGGFVLTRLIGPEVRVRLVGLFALLTSVPLVVFLFEPPLWMIAVLLVASGAFGAHQFVANAAFVLCAPESGRGLAFGLVASGLQAVQGLGIVTSSLLVGVLGSYPTVALAGACGVAGAVALLTPWRRLAEGVIERMSAPESTARPSTG